MTNVQIEGSTTLIIENVAPLFISHKKKIYENKTHTDPQGNLKIIQHEIHYEINIPPFSSPLALCLRCCLRDEQLAIERPQTLVS